MDLPQSKTQEYYKQQIHVIEELLRSAHPESEKDDAIIKAQKRLDELAKKFEGSKELGKAEYKLYELQAIIHYFRGNDEEALDFINHAIDTRGDTYAKAENIKAQLRLHSASLSAQGIEQNKLVGIAGWLLWFCIGLGFAVVYNLFQLFTYPSAFNDIESIREQAPDFVSNILPVLWFEVFGFIMLALGAIWLIVLFAQHKRAGRNAVILYLIVAFILGIIDYAWASSIFSMYNISIDADTLNQQGSAIGRSVVAACIWIPYFLVSKRVKATLVK